MTTPIAAYANLIPDSLLCCLRRKRMTASNNNNSSHDEQSELPRKNQKLEARQEDTKPPDETSSFPSQTANLPSMTKDVSQPNLILDIFVLALDNSPLRCRLLLGFTSDIDIIADDIRELLKIEIRPTSQAWVQIEDHTDTAALGEIEAQWRICEGETNFVSEFVVIKSKEYDVLLGRPSIEKLDLGRVHSKIAERLKGAS